MSYLIRLRILLYILNLLSENFDSLCLSGYFSCHKVSKTQRDTKNCKTLFSTAYLFPFL
jgi:hypothetical protein